MSNDPMFFAADLTLFHIFIPRKTFGRKIKMGRVLHTITGRVTRRGTILPALRHVVHGNAVHGRGIGSFFRKAYDTVKPFLKHFSPVAKLATKKALDYVIDKGQKYVNEKVVKAIENRVPESYRGEVRAVASAANKFIDSSQDKLQKALDARIDTFTGTTPAPPPKAAVPAATVVPAVKTGGRVSAKKGRVTLSERQAAALRARLARL